MKIKFTTKQLVIFLLVVGIGTTSVYYGYKYYLSLPQPIIFVDYYGSVIRFRQDLKEANNISLYPNEEAIVNAVMNSTIKNLTIVFQNTTENGIVGVEAVEITYKLRIGHLTAGLDIPISSRLVDSINNITGSPETPIIVITPPSLANETSVRLDNYVIYISGKNNKQLDLATIKFLMVALGIKI